MRQYHQNHRGMKDHPPAPFHIDDENDGTLHSYAIRDNIGFEIARCGHYIIKESKAVAELFRSAPAMYQRLVLAQRCLLQGDEREALNQIRLGLAGIYEGNE